MREARRNTKLLLSYDCACLRLLTSIIPGFLLSYGRSCTAGFKIGRWLSCVDMTGVDCFAGPPSSKKANEIYLLCTLSHDVLDDDPTLFLLYRRV